MASFDARGEQIDLSAVLNPAPLSVYQTGVYLHKDPAGTISLAKNWRGPFLQRTSGSTLVSSVDMASQRYVGGRSSYYEVLQAQQELFPTQRTQIQAQVGEILAVIQLYRALGGGWQPAGAP